MGIYTNTEEYLWGVAVKKIVIAGVGALAGLLTKYGIVSLLTAYGVTLNIDPAKLQEGLIVAGVGAFAGVHDYLKLHFPDSKWL